MTKSAAASELTCAEIWTLAKTAIELFGASVSRFANKLTSYSTDSNRFIDITAKRDDGQFSDLGTREDQDKLEQMRHGVPRIDCTASALYCSPTGRRLIVRINFTPDAR